MRTLYINGSFVIYFTNKKKNHRSNIWYYIFLLLDLEIIWSFQIFYFHFIMGLLDTCHDLESFHKGLGKEVHHFSG